MSVSNCVFFANIASAVVSISPFLVRILSATASSVVIKVSTLVSFTKDASATTSNWVSKVSLLVCFTKLASATTSNCVMSVSIWVFFANIASDVVSNVSKFADKWSKLSLICPKLVLLASLKFIIFCSCE